MDYDLNCPYCDEGLEVCHDDGFGYEENTKHEMSCDSCGKEFVFTTSIMYLYEPEQADCLNDGKHDYKCSKTYPPEFSTMICTMCDDKRELTEEERVKFGIGTKDSYFHNLR